MRGSNDHGDVQPTDERGPDPVRAHRPKAVYVAGNGHSGSTVLELLLANSPHVVGLGEVASVLRILHERTATEPAALRCSCRRDAEQCPLWGPLLPRLRAAATTHPGGPAWLRHAYPMVIEHVAETFPDATIVDSSKNEDALDALAAAIPGEVAVVHLIRDVRSWSASSRARLRRADGPGLAALLRRPSRRALALRLHRTYPARFRRWHERNLQLDRALAARGEPVTRVSYEELTTDPRVLAELRRHLGLAAPDGPARPNRATAHSIGGNRMRLSDDATAEVAYSTSWLRERGWILPSLLLRSTMRYNAERTYGGVRTTKPTGPTP